MNRFKFTLRFTVLAFAVALGLSILSGPAYSSPQDDRIHGVTFEGRTPTGEPFAYSSASRFVDPEYFFSEESIEEFMVASNGGKNPVMVYLPEERLGALQPFLDELIEFYRAPKPHLGLNASIEMVPVPVKADLRKELAETVTSFDGEHTENSLGTDLMHAMQVPMRPSDYVNHEDFGPNANEASKDAFMVGTALFGGIYALNYFGFVVISQMVGQSPLPTDAVAFQSAFEFMNGSIVNGELPGVMYGHTLAFINAVLGAGPTMFRPVYDPLALRSRVTQNEKGERILSQISHRAALLRAGLISNAMSLAAAGAAGFLLGGWEVVAGMGVYMGARSLAIAVYETFRVEDGVGDPVYSTNAKMNFILLGTPISWYAFYLSSSPAADVGVVLYAAAFALLNRVPTFKAMHREFAHYEQGIIRNKLEPVMNAIGQTFNDLKDKAQVLIHFAIMRVKNAFGKQEDCVKALDKSA